MSIKAVIAKPAAFFWRDLRFAASYRLSFATSVFSMIAGLFSMNFLSGLVNQGSPQALAAFGGDYFSFVVIGLAIALFGRTIALQFSSNIRSAQMTGTLEVMVGSCTGLSAMLLYSALYGTAFAVFQLIATLAIGALVLGANLHVENALPVFLVFLLTSASFAGIGILSASFVVWSKQNEPLTGLVLTSSALVSGILYPTSVLPGWLERLAPFLPLTHSAAALRETLIVNASTSSVAEEILYLAGFGLLLPVSLLVFSFAVRQAKVAGSLSHY